jgi:hypothetical protein
MRLQHVGCRMRQVLLGLVWMMMASAACAETYSFTAVTTDGSHYQTLVNCTGPKTTNERVPKGCILSEPATAYPNSLCRWVPDCVSPPRHLGRVRAGCPATGRHSRLGEAR